MKVLHVQRQQLRQVPLYGPFDQVPELCRLQRQIGVKGSCLRFGQVPQHLVELADDFEGGEHLVPSLRVFAPALTAEQPLGDGLAGAETVKDGAAAESPRAEGVMDSAGKVGGKVAAGRSGRFVEGKIRRPGEAKGCAAKGKAAGAVGTQ